MDYLLIEDIDELENIIPILASAYHNDKPLVNDVIFDKLVSKLKKKNPKSLILKQIGAPIRKDKKKVKLPIFMSSMDKMRPDSNELRIFLKRTENPYFVSDKIDGAACLLEYEEGKLKNMFTRGNGKLGQDINFLIGHLKIPHTIDNKNTIFIKGELTVTLKDYKNKFIDDASKPRGVITGVYNSLEPDLNKISSFKFLAYEYYDQDETPDLRSNDLLLKPSQQFIMLKKLGFKSPENILIEDLKSDKFLEKHLNDRKRKTIFEIDGLIIASDYPYKIIKKDNPKHAVAFKINEEGQETIVVGLTWEPTKHGILFPVIEVEPIIIEGDNIKHVSGKNAKFIIDNNIGINTVLSLIKSGGVIPEIVEVLESTSAKLPKGIYGWDENDVNIVLEKPLLNETVRMKRILHFFEALEVKSLKIGNIKKLFQNGLNDFDKIIKAKKEDFLEADGIKEKTADILYRAIHSIIDKPLELSKIMFASLCFDKGLGTRRFELLLENFPCIYNLIIPDKDDILNVEGIGEIITEQFLEGFVKFKKFIIDYSFLNFSKPVKKTKDGKYKDHYILFSGFRDKELEQKLISEGATIEKSFTKKISILIVKELDASSNKIIKAKEKGIKIILKIDI